jgi:hypothetical protein
MLLLGVLQAQAAGQVAGTFELLETQVLTSAAASVTFSSLSTYSAEYQHLQIRMVCRSARGSEDYLQMRFNGDTGSNYSNHYLEGNGSSVGSSGSANQTQMYQGVSASSNLAANIFASFVIDILDPFETTKFTTSRTLGGFATRSIGLNSGNWRNTDALTSITLRHQVGDNLVTGSRFSLYGIRGG